jgi:hypothetical protein
MRCTPLGVEVLSQISQRPEPFRIVSTKRYGTQVTREDIVRHMNLLRDEGLAPGTAFDHGIIVVDVCRRAGLRQTW